MGLPQRDLLALRRPLGDINAREGGEIHYWGLLGRSWGVLGPLLGCPWPLLGDLGAAGGDFESIWGSIWGGFWIDLDGFGVDLG